MQTQERLARCAHRRMNDRLEPGQRRRIAKHRRTELGAVDALAAGRTRKGALDCSQELAVGPLHPPHLGIGVEHRHAAPFEHVRDRRLAHPDRAGEPEDERLAHAASRARNARSPSSRGGGWWKNFSNATAAWPISIDSPSMVRNPEARAAWSNGV